MRGLFLLLMLAWTGSGPALVADEPLRILAPPVPPFHYTDPASGEIAGSNIDMLRKLAEHAGMKLDLTIVSWARALRETGEMSDVMLMPLSRTPEREDNYHWILPLRSTSFGVFGPKGKTREDFWLAINYGGERVYCETDAIQCRFLQDAGVSEDLIQPYWGLNVSRIIELVTRGRVRYFVAEGPEVEQYFRDKSGLDEHLSLVFNLSPPVTDYLAIPKSASADLVQKLEAAAAQMKASQ